MDKQQSAASQLSKVNKKERKKERFITLRMWISTIISALYNDRGKIPANIGNNILVTNNQYITKYSLNAMIIVKEMSEETPVGWVSDMLREVKSSVPNIMVDVSFKNQRHVIDVKNSGLENRERQWEFTLENPYANEASKKRAARLLYTADLARKRTPMYRTRIFITVRANNGTDLDRGIRMTIGYLEGIGAKTKFVKSNMQEMLEYNLIMSDRSRGKVKDIPANTTTCQTQAELLPSTQGLNDDTGTFLGIDREMDGPYFINFRASAKAKNIYVVGLSGHGKTFMVLSWLLDFYAQGYNCCIMDIKGNEFSTITRACGGKTLSMRASSTYYVNTFTMDKNELKEGDSPRVYFDTRFNLSKEIISIVCSLPDELAAEGEALIEEFLHSAYDQLGVLADNPNTWYRTENLTPYKIYELFMQYMSPAVKTKFSTVATKMMMRMKIYMSPDGSAAHMFRDAYAYKELLDCKMLTFDFGILESGTAIDPAMFKLRVLFMTLINDEYVSYKKSKGEWTVKVLEESQVAEDYLLKIYAKEFTLRRSQNQVTILLGNSISALAQNPISVSIIDNINILAVGVVHRSSQDYLIDEFGLDKYEDKLIAINENPDYENTFLLVNKMQKDATTALIKVFIPPNVTQGKIYKVVDVKNEEEED